MNKMKKSLLTISSIFIAFSSYAQDSSGTYKKKQKEVAIAFTNLDNFGLSYRFGNTKSMWRINSLLFDGGNFEEEFDSITRNSSSIAFGVQFGKEFRKEISKNFELRYGADVSFTYGYNKNDNSADGYYTETKRYMPGINLMLGFNYVMKNNIIIGIETMPSVNYSVREMTTESNGTKKYSDITTISYALSTNSFLLTIAYRF
jgi:hypothetical protein